MSERIIFLGRLSDDALALAYQAADVFLLPTTALECFGLIILEAFACECPVIATDAGAIPEVMPPDLSDFILPAGDHVKLSGAIQALLDHRLGLPEPTRLARKFHKKMAKSASLC